jgi:hypothetical protein
MTFALPVQSLSAFAGTHSALWSSGHAIKSKQFNDRNSSRVILFAINYSADISEVLYSHPPSRNLLIWALISNPEL